MNQTRLPLSELEINQAKLVKMERDIKWLTHQIKEIAHDLRDLRENFLFYRRTNI